MIEFAELTDEQVARQLRVVGARRALLAAPDVIGFARSRILNNRSGEAGVEVRQERTPLHAGWTDTADAAYTQLLTWACDLGPQIGVEVPDPGSPWLRWRGDLGQYEILGFRGDVAAPIATKLTRIVTRWLIEHLPEIERTALADEFLTDAMRVTWSLKATVGMSRRERPPAAPRPCPVCGEHEVRATYFGESLTAAELRGERWMTTRTEDYMDGFLVHIGKIQVRCSQCGHEVVATDREKVSWLA